ncbi:ParB/RepB/Spo0J family partition protein [Sulfurivermis fontis]|uniref:ParB/RepB/Spo0J family partition protein n=1 Tax=Sulfurivermis fontis TaxID=1972068 RepID=UPI000FDA8C59|nr:ParB/RepB/Spo0J family partition protein [Sulfurivermis fontis]
MPVFRLERMMGAAIDVRRATPGQPGVSGPGRDGSLVQVGIEQLRRGRFQPRHEFPAETLQELAASIRAQGVVQPIVVRPVPDGGYEIVAGERRWRAAQIAGLWEVPVVIRIIDDTTAALFALAENVQRENLNPIDEAEGIARLVDDLGLTHQDVADALGYKREHVSHLLRITRLEPQVKALVASGFLTFGHAKVLVGLARNAQIAMAQTAAERGWTVRRLEQQVRAPSNAHSQKNRRDPDIARLERRVGETVGSPTSLDFDEASKNGTITFRFHSHEELEGILARLGVRVDQ